MFFEFTTSLPPSIYIVLWYSSNQVVRKPPFLPWELSQDQPITASCGGKIIYPTLKKTKLFSILLTHHFLILTENHTKPLSPCSFSQHRKWGTKTKKKRESHTIREQWRKKKEQWTGKGKKRGWVGLPDVVSTNRANFANKLILLPQNDHLDLWDHETMRWSEAQLFMCTAKSWWEIVERGSRYPVNNRGPRWEGGLNKFEKHKPKNRKATSLLANLNLKKCSSGAENNAEGPYLNQDYCQDILK